ncbi:MAG TPA: hypothetical protein VFQ44_18820 [Streptosporangiaceae bacterium]|nr:hypothetical protein [Streptosporangiaceae bacterium]
MPTEPAASRRAQAGTPRRPDSAKVPAGHADDARYPRRAEDLEQGRRAGNPPGCKLLDTQIARLARQFHEYSYQDLFQAEIDAAAESYLEWNQFGYPPYEGPGYTEPPLNWEGYHKPRTEHERDHYWDYLDPDLADPTFPGQSDDNFHWYFYYGEPAAWPDREAGQ